MSLKPHKKCNKLNKMKYEPKKVIEIPEIEFNRVVAGQYKTSVINPDGSVESEGDWSKNLILDCGLDKIAYMPWAQVFQFCVAGDQLSGSVSPATIFDTQLEKPAMMNSFYLPGSGNCGSDIYSSGDDRYLKLFRTFDFLAQKQNTVITELGFKETPGAKKLFSRVVLDGNTAAGRPDPEVVRVGQYLRVKYELNIQLDPVTPSAAGVVPTGSDGNLPTIAWSGSASDLDRHGLQKVGMVGIDAHGRATPQDIGGACNEPFAVGAVDFGPGFGYVNRWQNGEGVPTQSVDGVVVGYKQPVGTERLSDRPGPLLSLFDYQDFNRHLNHDCITGNGHLGTNTHHSSSGIAPTATNNPLVSGASGYWPWGDYFTVKQMTNFASINSLSAANYSTTNSNSYGYNMLWHFANAQDDYEDFRTRPFFSHGPMTLVMRPVNRYGQDMGQGSTPDINWASFPARTDGNQGHGSVGAGEKWYNLFNTEISSNHNSTISKRAQHSNVDHWYAPNQNSEVGSYLTFDEQVTNRGFLDVSNSVFWDPWDMRGASCFLSTHTGQVEPFAVSGVDNDRSSGEYFSELPLRKAEYATGQVGDSRTLTKFCFFDNAVANSIENGQVMHDAWQTIGVGPTTNWSINPATMSGAARDNGYVYRLETGRHKDNDHILKVSFKYTWTRNTGQL
ncbi:MAG: hypothetical protein CME35_01085 [Gramella sp.]|nr:hypothetical protein [Christiangramia sp.]